MSVYLLRCLSISYLLIPNLIFFIYWTRSSIAVVGVAVLIFLFFQIVRDSKFGKTESFNGKDVTILAAVTLAVTLISGINGICYQTFDYWCHNTKFYELFKYSWPIRIPLDGPVISYYYGYYVVPALISKWLGGISETVIFIWTYLGFFLGLAWVYLALNKKIIFAILALSVGDTPHLLKSIFYKLFGRLYEFGDFGIESWSNFENSLWVPNQVIPTLIIGGMFVYILKNRLELEYMVLPVALTFWWAVFPAFTSGLLIAILVIRKWILAKFQLNWIQVITKVGLPAVACFPILIFFLSHEEAPISGFIWQFPDSMSNRMIEYLVNIGINLAIFILIYVHFKKYSKIVLPFTPFFVILIFIMIFPVYRMGKVNDFLFRGLMPYLIIAGIYLFYPLSEAKTYRDSWTLIKKTPYSLILFLLLACSSLIAAGRFYRAMTVNQISHKMYPDKVAFDPIPYDAYPNIYEVLKDRWSQREADQYLGKKDSFYELNMTPTSR